MTHHMSTSSFNTSQWRLCSLSIAAACQKSCHTSRLLPSRAKSWQMMCWYFTSSRAVWAQFECNMFQASIQELRTETCRLVLLFLATWPTSNPSSNRGRSWSTEPYDWSAAHMKLLLYGCEPVNISTTVWDDF